MSLPLLTFHYKRNLCITLQLVGADCQNIEISFAGIIFDGSKSIPGTWATPEQETPYTF